MILIDEICNNLSVNTQYSLLKYLKLKSVKDNQAHLFTSEGVESYSIEDSEKEDYGTVITLYLKDDTEDDKYSDYLNVVICESDGKNGLHYTSYVDVDTSIKQGIEMKSKKILEGYDVLSKILDYPVEKLKKFKI